MAGGKAQAMGLKDFIEWLKTTLPAELRAPFTTGVMLLVLTGIVVKFAEGFEWPEVFREWWFLLAVSVVLVFWAVTVLRVQKAIHWPWAASWAVAAVMALAAVACAFYCTERARVRYDRAGFYASRAWMRDAERGPGYWEWMMEPTADLSKSVITVQMEPGAGCDASRFDGPSPVRSGESAHGARIMDASSLEHPNTVWKVRDLHAGEELVFRLLAKNPEDAVCLRPLVTLGEK
jgi:hypothetical protein